MKIKVLREKSKVCQVRKNGNPSIRILTNNKILGSRLFSYQFSPAIPLGDNYLRPIYEVLTSRLFSISVLF